MWMFITVFTTAYNMSLSRAISVQYPLPAPISLSYILILLFNLRLRVSSVPFLSDFTTTYLSRFVFFPFVCLNIYLLILFSLYNNLTNFDSEKHLKLRFVVLLYIFTFYGILSGCYGGAIHPEALLIRDNTTFSNKHTHQYFQLDSNP
jgi:hypothetical protein